ncbi:AAA family ATPase [Streptomyces sp. NPDC048404]|uniref:nSTAND1 domain-containing NTPase n=1 Tax=unclassified Streptomyces TaxID=2593676 RepID=UPI00342793D8
MGRIFISYHAPEGGDIVRHLVDALKAAGFRDCYAYDLVEHGPEASYLWRQDLRRNLLAAEALLVVTTPHAKTAEWCAWEVSVFPERKPEALVLELTCGVEAGRALLNERQTVAVDADDPESLDRAVRTTLCLLTDHGVSKAPELTSPFPGLSAFEEEHASVFFGRKQDVERLVRPMLGSRRSGSLAVVGPSGAGKSSLVRAGLVPHLRRRPPVADGTTPPWIVLGPFRPADGIAALASTVAEIRGDLKLDVSTTAEVESRITAAPEELAALLADVAEAAPEARIVIVLDQAEELLWQSEETKVLVSGLVSATRSRAWLVYTVRADLLDALMSEEVLAPLVADDFLVKPLGRADLPLIINGPLDRLGWRMSEEALGRMVEDATGETLPLLAFALHRLWQHVNPGGRRNPRTISLRDYTEAGRVQDVLREQAEDAFAVARDLVLDADAGLSLDRATHTVLRTVRRLVSVDAAGTYTRRSVPVSDLPSDEARLLKPFVDRRVISIVQSAIRVRGDGDGRPARNTQDFLQVAHESLFLHWPRLREVLDQERDALRARQEVEDLATAWEEAGRPRDQMIPPSRLLLLLAVLSPLFEPAPGANDRTRRFTHGWPHLHEKLVALQLSTAAITLMNSSLQRNLADEVSRAQAMAANPQTALRILAGAASLQGDDMLRMLLHAPDIVTWERALRSAMGDLCLTRTLTGHEQGIWGVAWSPDDSRVVTGSKDGSVRVWDVDSGTCVARFDHGKDRRSDNPGWVRSVAWSPRGDLIASTATDETARLWSPADHREVGLIPLPDRPWSVRFDSSGEHLLVACADGNAYVHAIRGLSRDPVRVFANVAQGKPVRLWDADLSADGRLVACAREDGEVEVHAVDGSRILPHPRSPSEEPRSTVRSVRFSPDTRRLATGDQANNVRIRRLGGDSILLQGHRDQVRRVNWSPRGLRLATASADETVRIWSTNTGAEGTLLTLRQHEQGVCDVAWSHEGDRLASVSDDGRARIWKTGSDPRAEVLTSVDNLTAMARCSRTGRLVLGTDQSLGTDRPALARCGPPGADANGTVPYRLHRPGLASLAWSPDGTRLLAGSLDGTVSILSVAEDEAGPELRLRQKPHVLSDAHDGVHDAQWSSDGAYIAVVSRDRTWLPRVYDREGRLLDGERRGSGWTTHQSFLRAVAWHPTRTLFAVAGQDNMVTLNTLETTVAYWRTEKVFTSLAWNPHGDRLAVGCTDGTVIVLDAGRATQGTVAERLRLRGHEGAVNSLAWSTNGDTLLTASDDGTARTWHTGNGGLLTVARVDTGPVVRALWLDGPHRALTASAAGFVHLWDLSDGPARPLSAMECDVHTLITEARLRTR